MTERGQTLQAPCAPPMAALAPNSACTLRPQVTAAKLAEPPVPVASPMRAAAAAAAAGIWRHWEARSAGICQRFHSPGLRKRLPRTPTKAPAPARVQSTNPTPPTPAVRQMPARPAPPLQTGRQVRSRVDSPMQSLWASGYSCRRRSSQRSSFQHNSPRLHMRWASACHRTAASRLMRAGTEGHPLHAPQEHRRTPCGRPSRHAFLQIARTCGLLDTPPRPTRHHPLTMPRANALTRHAPPSPHPGARAWAGRAHDQPRGPLPQPPPAPVQRRLPGRALVHLAQVRA